MYLKKNYSSLLEVIIVANGVIHLFKKGVKVLMLKFQVLGQNIKTPIPQQPIPIYPNVNPI